MFLWDKCSTSDLNRMTDICQTTEDNMKICKRGFVGQKSICSFPEIYRPKTLLSSYNPFSLILSHKRVHVNFFNRGRNNLLIQFPRTSYLKNGTFMKVLLNNHIVNKYRCVYITYMYIHKLNRGTLRTKPLPVKEHFVINPVI